MAVDAAHQLWVANTNAFNIVAFKRGSTTPFQTLNDPSYYPISVAVDGNGTVYAANAESSTGPPGNVTGWKKGHTNPTATLTS
jgi:sugar lactone lactonase YvrE